MSSPSHWEMQFVEYLESLVKAEDRAALAALRRGLGKPLGTVAEQHRYVARWAPKGGPPWHEEIYYLVAGLFAAHQKNWPPCDSGEITNFGASFRQLSNATQSASVEKRFVALLSSRCVDLPEHLRHAVSLLKAREVPIDWAQLLHDIRHWDHPDRFVQRNWARAFWAGDTEDAARLTAPARTSHEPPPAG